MIHIVAILTAQPGQRDAVLDIFRANMQAVHAEAGCIEYIPVIDAPGVPFQAPIGPDSFMVLEKWADMPALAAHAASPHMKAYGRATKDLVVTRTIHVLSPA